MGKSLTQPEADLQLLLKEIMPITERGLQQRNGFPPVGAVIETDGRVRRIESAAGPEKAAKEAAELLRQILRREVEAGCARSAAVAADVRIWRRKDGDEAANAVSVHVEHQDGYCVDLLIPYKVRKGMLSKLTSKPQVIFRKMIAQESEPIFGFR